MKSSPERLAQRGYLAREFVTEELFPDRRTLDAGLQGSEAWVRTAAIRSLRPLRDDARIPELCALLSREKALYTKIEICECLAEYGPRAVPALLPLLGRIGNNQHRGVITPDLGKKSFPLPRDLVARILIRMGPLIVEELLQFMRSSPDLSALSEVIDVIGHISFYSGDRRAESRLLTLYQETNEPLLQWKIIRAFQSFDSAETRALLHGVLADPEGSPEMQREAERSLKRISERRGTSHVLANLSALVLFGSSP